MEAPPTGPSGSFILNLLSFGCKRTLKQRLLFLFCVGTVNPNGGGALQTGVLQTGVLPRRRDFAATVRAAQCHASVFIGKTFQQLCLLFQSVSER